MGSGGGAGVVAAAASLETLADGWGTGTPVIPKPLFGAAAAGGAPDLKAYN